MVVSLIVFLFLALNVFGTFSSLSPSQLSWFYYDKAQLYHFGTGGYTQDLMTAISYYREGALLRAGPGSGASLSALARLYETGWEAQVGGADTGGVPEGDKVGSLGEVEGGVGVSSSLGVTTVNLLLARISRLFNFYGQAYIPSHTLASYKSQASRRAAAYALAQGLASTLPVVSPPQEDTLTSPFSSPIVHPSNSEHSGGQEETLAPRIPQDLPVALALWRAAADEGDPYAHFTMAVIYELGIFGESPDPPRAALHRHFASQGSPATFSTLAASHQR